MYPPICLAALALLTSGCALVGPTGRMAGCTSISEDELIQIATYGGNGNELFHLIADGEYAAAAQCAEKIIAIHPSHQDAHFILAVTRAHLGDMDGALEQVEASLAGLVPRSRYQAGPREILGPLSDDPEFASLLASDETAVVHGPLLGQVTATEAAFWVRTSSPATIQTEAWPRSEPANVIESAPSESSRESDFAAVVAVGGLMPETDYRYRLIVNGVPLDQTFEFTTFPSDGGGSKFELAFGACADWIPSYMRMWSTIAERDPLALLMLGDNVYADAPDSVAIQRLNYYRMQSQQDFRALTGETPVFSVWDDHDFAIDNSEGGPDPSSPAWKVNALQVFKENWNNPSYGGDSGEPGVWFKFSIGDVEVFMLDSRYYRTQPGIPGGSMLGATQLNWLLDALDESSATFKIIASSVPWAPGANTQDRDAWDGYPAERQAIFDYINDHSISGVLLISGDRHRSDAWLISNPGGYDFYEFESGRLANERWHDVSSAALFSYNAKPSFGSLEFDTQSPDPTVTYRIISIDGEVVYKITVRLSQLAAVTQDTE